MKLTFARCAVIVLIAAFLLSLAVPLFAAYERELIVGNPNDKKIQLTRNGELKLITPNGANASFNPFDYTATLGIMNGSDTFTLFDINMTNANHTGSSNVVTIMDVANITGDSAATETGIAIGTGWDNAFTASSPVTLTSIAASDSLVITGNALTSADAIQITADNDILNGGMYLNCIGGSAADTAVFTVGEDGATTIASVGTATNSLSITNNATTSGDLLSLTGDDDTLDADTFYISCLGGTDHATSVFTLGESGVMTFGDGGTIDGTTGSDVLNLTETTVRATGNLDVTGTGTVAGSLAANGGITVDSTAFTVTDATGAIASTATLASQTTENVQAGITLTTDSTFLTGTDITYSGGRGSSALKLTGTWSGASGGYSNIYSNVTKSGNTSAAVDGAIGVKSIVTNTGAMTDGSVYGGQFWAKHSHATNDMANEAALIGLEGFAYDATSGGTVGTLIGTNVGYHNEVDTAKPAGSVHRALQVVCDDAAGADVADEATGICIWNMAGTQTDGIKFVRSGSGFTTDVTLQQGETLKNTSNGYIDVGGALRVRAATATVPIVKGAVTDYDAQAATLTIAGLLGGFVTQNSKTGASTATTPTGTEISAGITDVATGDSFTCVYYNRGNQTSTITAGASGVTVYGTAAITTTKTATLNFICTGANTWSCYVVAGA